MEVTVASLLLITASVVLACICVTYAVNIVQQTLNQTNIPASAQIKNMESSLLNQTQALYNQTQTGPLQLPSPSP